jgi:acyl-CoA thioesterase I
MDMFATLIRSQNLLFDTGRARRRSRSNAVRPAWGALRSTVFFRARSRPPTGLPGNPLLERSGLRFARPRGLSKAIAVLAILFPAGLLGLEVLIARRRAYLTDAKPGLKGERFGLVGPSLDLVVIGDSTAIGVGAGSRDGSYPVMLAERLGEQFSVRLHVLGGSGTRLGDAAAHLASAASALRPDIVLVGLGANDAVRLTSLQRVGRYMRDILHTLEESSAAVVVLLGPTMNPPALAPPLRRIPSFRYRAVSKVMRREAMAHGAIVVDLKEVIGDAFTRDPGTYFSEDGFHPSEAGYSLWADAMKDALLRVAYQCVQGSLER